jgi:potassium-transporting ATPase KdpC subunit
MNFLQSFKMLLVMAVLTGLIYPLLLVFISHLTMPWAAQGSIVLKNEKAIGSKLIGQQFTSKRYFWSRPSAVNYSTLPAGGSNLGPTSAKLQNIIQQRRIKIAQAHKIQDLSNVPIELVCASASGIDPHISLDTAYFQLARVAEARDLISEALKLEIVGIIQQSLDKPIGKIFGSPHVNVLMLNLALDEFETKERAKTPSKNKK